MRTLVAFFLGVLAASAALGCGRIETVKKCKALAGRVNAGLDEIEAKLGPKPDAQAYRAAASRYGALAKELATVDAGAEELNRSVVEYTGTLRAAEAHTRALASAVETANEPGISVASRELERVGRQQKQIVKRLAHDCEGH